MKRLVMLAIVSVLAVSCSSTDSDQPYGRRGGYGGYGDGGSYVANRPATGALDMLPPADWWRQPVLADAVRLTPDQVSSLERISQDQDNDLSRIESDMTIAVRDFRTQLDAPQPTSADIVTAGARVRALRDSMFDKQLSMLAAERAVLTLDQWHTLQQQLQDRRQQRQNDYGYPRRGGRGMGGRGRWPGY